MKKDRNEYYRGWKGQKYGIYNTKAKRFQFGICEDTPMLAEARLFQMIGDDARKWRFEPRALPPDGLSSPLVVIDEPEKREWEWFEEWSPSTPEHPRECDDCGWRCGKCKVALEDTVGGYWDNAFEKPKLHYCPNCGAKMKGE